MKDLAVEQTKNNIIDTNQNKKKEYIGKRNNSLTNNEGATVTSHLSGLTEEDQKNFNELQE